MVNGHGSNQNLVETAARLAMVEEPGSLVAASFYLVSERSARVIEEVRTSDRGGMAHACELETSLYLHLHPEAVDMSQAVDERGYAETEHAWMDWSDGPLKIMPWWSSFSESGVQGDASKATAEKGEALFEAATQGDSRLRDRAARACLYPRERITIDASRAMYCVPAARSGCPAPAQGYHNRSEVLRGVEWWEERGYNVKLGRNIFARDGYVAGSAEGRAQDIMDMFTDDEVDIVHCFQGGYGSAQTIDFLDFDAIRANPKALIGYSDITALHTALRHYTELVTFYGPGLAGVNARETKPFTQERLLKALTSTGPLGEVPRDPEERLHKVARGRVGERPHGWRVPVAAGPGNRDAVAAGLRGQGPLLRGRTTRRLTT